MSKASDPAIAALQERLNLLNRHPVVKERDRIAEAIAILGGRSTPPAVEPVDRVRKQGRQPKVKARSGGRKGFRKNAKGDPSIASLVAEAGKAQPGDFTIIDLRTYLDKHYPERFAKLTNDDLSKHVYILRTRGQFTLVQEAERGVKGAMNKYRYNDKK